MTKNIDTVLLVGVMGDVNELVIDREDMIDYQNARVAARHYDELVDKVVKLLKQKRDRLINLQGLYDGLPDSVSTSARDALAVAIEEVRATISDLEKLLDA